MGKRKTNRNVFDEIILGLSGKDLLACLEKMAEIQNNILKKPAGGDKYALKEAEEALSKYPRRYRIIYKGFALGWNLEKLNRALEEKRERKLYARDLIEATLLYSFRKKLSFDEWKYLVEELEQLEATGSYDELLITGPGGSYTAFPLWRIENYVKVSSISASDPLYTIQQTKTIEKQLGAMSEDREFVLYICENIRNFSEGREKARYYICKYFLLYLNTRINAYMSSDRSRTDKRNIYLDLPLSNISKMDPNRHAHMTRDQVRECLNHAKVSSNKLFELINRFYSYILLSDSDAEDPGWEEYSLMSNILRGDTISRTLLLLLLLFFDTEAKIEDENLRLTRHRADEILKACSFEPLTSGSDNELIDGFILEAICSDNRKTVIEKALYQMDVIDLI